MNLTKAQMTLLAAPYFYGPRPGSNYWSFLRLFHPITKETIAEGVEIEADYKYLPTFAGREALAAAISALESGDETGS